jgi:hypothetical protein
VLAPAFAFADDAAMSWGGTPTMLKGHKTIRMQSEHVIMTIHEDHAAVDCYFVFENTGPATSVKIGFPDTGWGASAEDYGIAKASGQHPKPFASFTKFNSFVDGKPVPTKLESAPETTDGNPSSWHTKIVNFGSHQTLTVRDVYDIPLGEAITSSPPKPLSEEAKKKGITTQVLFSSEYTLATGSSWKGTIGKAQVDVVFAPDASFMLSGVHPVADLGSSAKDPRGYMHWDQVPDGVTYYHSRIKPSLTGQKLVFIAKNLKPTTADDIIVYFYR